MLLDEDGRGVVQVTSPPVVAALGPLNRPRWGIGTRRWHREEIDEGEVARDDTIDLLLLEHQLGDGDRGGLTTANRGRPGHPNA